MPRKRARPEPPPKPEPGVRAEASVRFDLSDLDGWPPEKIAALLGGIGLVLAANRPERLGEPLGVARITGPGERPGG
jgi:hypothetical protein